MQYQQTYRASLVAQLVKNLPVMQETWVRSLCLEDPLEKVMLPPPLFWPGEFHGCTAHGVANSLTQLSDFHCTDNIHTNTLAFLPSSISFKCFSLFVCF